MLQEGALRCSAVIPTYNREAVLLNSIGYLLGLSVAPSEILVIDQTRRHEAATETELEFLSNLGTIRWIRLDLPSITHAMNVGLNAARSEVVLFLDDDIIPDCDLVDAHLRAHQFDGVNVVAGQVLQPGEVPLEPESEEERFLFRSSRKQQITELMGGNFSVNRELAIKLGGFDENFVHVAYRFEAEFSKRVLDAGEKILFEPAAGIRHLKESRGGTRSYGHHLTTVRPSHAVGAYYYLLRSEFPRPGVAASILGRMVRSIRTKHHMRRPWWIPPTICSELFGLVWAIYLRARGPRLLARVDRSRES